MGAIILPVLRNTSNMIFLIIPYSISRCHMYSPEMCQDKSSFCVLMGRLRHPSGIGFLGRRPFVLPSPETRATPMDVVSPGDRAPPIPSPPPPLPVPTSFPHL